MRPTAILLGLLAAVLWSAPAGAKLVYVKRAGSVAPVVYVATDGGKQPRRLGIGRAPTISPNGQWVAFVAVPAGGSRMATLVLQRLKAGSQRLVMRAETIDSLRFSPDSTKLAAIAAGKRVRVYDIANGTHHVAAAGAIRGYSFSPDAQNIVYGKAVRAAFQAPSDLYVAPALGGEATQLTTTRDALNPVWGPNEIVFDRFKRRRGDAPAFNLWAVAPQAAAELRQLTSLTIPKLVSGLVPLEASADGRRLLSVFTGQNTEVGFTVRTANGKTRALSMNFETGVVGFDLAGDGKTILAHTGGWDPAAAHDVVTVPYGGGEPKVLVEGGAYPDWTR